MIDAPIIETQRLVLRGHRLADFPAIRDMWADPAVTRWIDGKPRPEEECWLKFLRNTGFWVHLGYGYWIVEDKASGEVIGELGFGDFKRDLTPSLAGKPEIGWAIAAAHHGQGYAGEGVSGALGWADRNMPGTFSCIIDPRNTPSLRLAAKHGFGQIATANYHGCEVSVFERPPA